jgi:hypothetical protein
MPAMELVYSRAPGYEETPVALWPASQHQDRLLTESNAATRCVAWLPIYSRIDATLRPHLL